MNLNDLKERFETELFDMDRIINELKDELDDFVPLHENQDPSSSDRKKKQRLKKSLILDLGQVYNGLESIFKDTCKFKKIVIKDSPSSHKKILTALRENNILKKETIDQLEAYRGFRHVFRHGYAHTIKNDRLIELSRELLEVYPDIKQQYQEFLEK